MTLSTPGVARGVASERRWDVEGELSAVAVFDDVTIDLWQTRSAPAEIAIDAWAIFRDVDVTVPERTYVELSGGGFRGHLTNETAPGTRGASRSRRTDSWPHVVVRRHGTRRRVTPAEE